MIRFPKGRLPVPEQIDPITSDPVPIQCDNSSLLGLAPHSMLDEQFPMPDPIVPSHERGSSTSADLEVKKFHLHWATSRDLGDVTGERFSNLGHLIFRGAWFLNPLFSVHAPTPSAEFFRAALKSRSQWLRTSRQVLSNHGQRYIAREAERLGRKAAYLTVLNADPERDQDEEYSESLRFPDFTGDLKAEVLAYGKIAKQFAFSGVMFIDGNHIDPRTWYSLADQLLHPDTAVVTVTRRRVDLAAYKATGDPEPLKAVALNELKSQLILNPGAALYVTPGLTIVAPCASPQFLKRAHAAEFEWHSRLWRALRGEKKTLARASDVPTRLLVHYGIFVNNGRGYLPGCWPDQRPSTTKLKLSPFRTPTFPLEFLGLDIDANTPSHRTPSTRPTSRPD
jgi:hypothetical protein